MQRRWGWDEGEWKGGVAKKEKKGEEKCLNLLLSRIILNIELTWALLDSALKFPHGGNVHFCS